LKGEAVLPVFPAPYGESQELGPPQRGCDLAGTYTPFMAPFRQAVF
jgi:hypothetical protein